MPAGAPQLIHEEISDDTVTCATTFAEGSLDGKIVGAVIGFLYRRRRYSIAICGDAAADPTWARGIVAAIDDELREMIHERSHRDTTI